MPFAEQTEPSPVPLLRLAGIGKSFAGVRVLEPVDFNLRPGEVHAIDSALAISTICCCATVRRRTPLDRPNPC